MASSTQEWIEELKGISVLELSERIKALEEEFGVSATAVAAKTLADFRRTSGLLEFKGGWMNGDVLSAEQVDAIAKLPSRDVLYGRLVGMVASPLTGLASALGGLIGGLARQLQAIADEDLVGGGTPAVAEATETPADAPEPEPDVPGAPAADGDAGPTVTPEEPGPYPDPVPVQTEPQED